MKPVYSVWDRGKNGRIRAHTLHHPHCKHMQTTSQIFFLGAFNNHQEAIKATEGFASEVFVCEACLEHQKVVQNSFDYSTN